ncbi:MAG: peptidoglycan DD-metalloendopeptidase family protein [Burkholderiaceae bacterium]
MQISYKHSMVLSLVCIGLVSGCSSSLQRAPVEERVTGSSVKSQSSTSQPAGNYVVRKGDTLVSIALENGANWHDLAKWNRLDNPSALQVGQQLRLANPASAPPPAAVVPADPTPGLADNAVVEVKPITLPGVAPGTASPPSSPVNGIAKPNVLRESEQEWVWPIAGMVVEKFVEGKNKGIDIAANVGDPVIAVADGKVIYASNSLPGYGNLVIIKHDPVYLTAYAHNKVLTVKQGAAVKKGQKIAEVGKVDGERVKLHFEVRKQGKPVDPLKYLPVR